MKQTGKKILTGKITVVSGLHIGAGNDRVEIGGIDSPVVKNPLTKAPYIPGSSIKGKMRSLLEWKYNKVAEDGKVHGCDDIECFICRIFGKGNTKDVNDKKDYKHSGPTRLIIRDAKLNEEFLDDDNRPKDNVTEEKSENTINRITAEANPRNIERVVSGVKFDFELVYRVFDIDGRDEEFFEKVKEGLSLLQNDYLGGSGSRGYGQIKFSKLELAEFYEGKEKTITQFNL